MYMWKFSWGIIMKNKIGKSMNVQLLDYVTAVI